MSGRMEAANLLRAIRAAGVQRAGDLIEWAVTIMPDSVTAQRLHVRALLSDGDALAAESAVERALLQRPNNVSLRLLRVECLVAQFRWQAADEEVRRALSRRPHHRRTRELAARIAINCGDHQRAAAILEDAASLPDDRARALLAEALLGMGDVQRAQWTLDAMQSPPPPRLTAAALRFQGRLLDAADVLEAAVQRQCDDETLCMLLSVLEETGDASRLQRAIARAGTDHPRSRSLAGGMLLSRGRFREAVKHAAAALRDDTHEAQSLSTLVVAAAMLGRPRLARRALARLRRTRDGINARMMAERWQRGMLGKLLRTQRDALQAGSDPGSSVLQALLEEAKVAAAQPLKKSRRIDDSAGGVAQLSERKNVLVSSPVDGD